MSSRRNTDSHLLVELAGRHLLILKCTCACQHIFKGRKRRCIIPARGGPCALCTSKSLPCSSTFTPAPSNVGLSPAPPNIRLSPNSAVIAANDSPSSLHAVSATECHEFTNSGIDDLPDQTICNELVDLYFELLYDKQHALFILQPLSQISAWVGLPCSWCWP
jgi:hypothetical protein